RREDHADLAAEMHVRVHLAGTVDAQALPAPNGDVLAEPADERLARLFDGRAAARELLGPEIGAALRSEGGLRHLAREILEIGVARGEVRLDVDLDEHAGLAVLRHERRDDAFGRNGAGALGALGEALLEDDL